MTNLIGISGKIGAGKDTLANIIQYICWCEKQNSSDLPSFEDWMEAENQAVVGRYSPWKIKKFAFKLKEIVCLLTGATMEQIENQDFKKQKLSAEWDHIPQWTGEFMVKQKAPIGWPAERVCNYTYRSLLQIIGTDLFRNQIHENVWVNALFADYKRWGNLPDQDIPEFYPKWIISDCRFPNEAKAIADRGGVMIRINRPAHDFESGVASASTHPSETALDNYKFDYTIDNNGSIQDLSNKVEVILKELKIIA